MRFIRCEVVVVDPDFLPPLVEARFLDATGRLTTILDKEPIFVSDGSPPGRGVVRCTELHRRSVDGKSIVTVSLDSPDSLETTDGRHTVDVFDSLLE